MLILPLHRAVNRSNFPLITLLLMLANVFVYLGLQSGDAKTYQQAETFYQQSSLGSIEFPAHLQWLREHAGDPKQIDAAENGPDSVKLVLVESDQEFLKALHADQVVPPSSPDYPNWHAQRGQFDAIMDATFTHSHAIAFNRFEPTHLLWAMFMHGSAEHIIGNMIFLAILGMLVEGALGATWYLVLYFVGGIGAGLTSLAMHWGSDGIGLGASGAIAAVMGAMCVCWGTRKIRVFYWFFVVFDYIKVPALVLLPFWFFALVLYPWLSHDNYIDFADHAGGILTGVVIALALRARGLVRDDFIDEDERVAQHQHHDASFELALQLIGRLEIPKARALLEGIDKAEPNQLRVQVALYRCARYGGTPAAMDAAIERVLAFPAHSAPDLREMRSAFEDYAKACAGAPRLPTELMMGLLPACQRNGEDALAESLLRGVAASAPDEPGLASAWFALALRAPDKSPHRRALLEYLLEHHAQSEFAPKARFLMGSG